MTIDVSMPARESLQTPAALNYSVGAFTLPRGNNLHNEDRVLVGEQVLSSGDLVLNDLPECACFVADGIGGNAAGDVAAQLLLSLLGQRIVQEREWSRDTLDGWLREINNSLIHRSNTLPAFARMGSVMIGLLARKDGSFVAVHAGDAEAWLLRGDIFFRINDAHVVDPFERNSPLTSCFGGGRDLLRLDYCDNLQSIEAGDIFLLASDGLFKSVSQRNVKRLLKNALPVGEQVRLVREEVVKSGNDDDVSVIIINVNPAPQS